MRRYIANIPGIHPDLMRPVRHYKNLPAWLSSNTVLTPSGTHALVLAYKTLGLKRGDAVLVPSFVCYSVVDPLLKLKAVPLYFDINIDGTIDWDHLKRKMNKRVKAMVWYYFMGLPVEYEAVISFCKKNNIRLVEDCAHAAFSMVNDKPIGRAGDVSIFSFRKTIPSLAGALVINNRRFKRPKHTFIKKYTPVYQKGLLDREVYHYRLYLQSQDSTKQVVRLPYRYYADSIDVMHADCTKLYPIDQASRLVLHNIEPNSVAQKRNHHFKIYLNLLSDISLFREIPGDVCPIGFPILVKRRDGLRKKLDQQGVESLIHWSKPLLPKGVYKRYPKAAFLADNLLTLPCHHDLTNDDVEYVCRIVKELLKL
jgi:dTDP-4-amino-4,6-dideoxygalactose transaminase